LFVSHTLPETDFWEAIPGEISLKLLNLLATPAVIAQTRKIRALACPTGLKPAFGGKSEFSGLSNHGTRTARELQCAAQEAEIWL
jgi:hypothetical protein